MTKEKEVKGKGPHTAEETWKGATVDKLVAQMAEEPPPAPKKANKEEKKS